VIAAKTARKDRKRLQFYDGFGNLMESEGFAVAYMGNWRIERRLRNTVSSRRNELQLFFEAEEL